MDLKLVVAILCFAAAAIAAPEPHPLSYSYIESINSKQTTWKAGRNFPENTPIKHLKSLLGYPPSFKVSDRKAVAHLPRVKYSDDVIEQLPESFDSRDKWPNCPSLSEIRDQSSCGSCWAFAATEVMTDRVCTYSNGTRNFHFAARDLISCCKFCGDGCKGGSTYFPYVYWTVDGVVSGGNYNSSQGCMPYPFAPCVHHNKDTTVNPIGNILPCVKELYDTPKCPDVCERNYDVKFKQDKIYGKKPILIDGGEKQIMAEIFANGPVQAPLDVAKDFYNYKSGVYVPTDEDWLGGHTVKILGWGVEDGVKYWLAANSWNTYWGDGGFFKIRRGQNDCDIEDLITAGEPLL